MKKKLISLILAAVMSVSICAAVTAFDANDYDYNDYGGGYGGGYSSPSYSYDDDDYDYYKNKQRISDRLFA